MSFFPNLNIGITGNVIPIYSALVGGTDGTNLRALLTDVSGQLKVLVQNFPGTQPISGTVTALQGTSPWVVSLASTTITGTVAVTQSTSPWVISFIIGSVSV